MASQFFRFSGCGHIEKNAKTLQLWRALQEREALPQELKVQSRLPCRTCSARRGDSPEEFYGDILFWLDGAWDDDITNDASMLAELVWVKSALDQRNPRPTGEQAMHALLAMNATRTRERHMDALEAELLSYFAEGCNVLRLYLQGLDPNGAGRDRGKPSSAPPLTEEGLNAFFFSQVLRFYNIGRKVNMVTAMHACLFPDDSPHLTPDAFAEHQRQIEAHVASLEAKAGDLIRRAADLANSLPIGRNTDKHAEHGAATADQATATIAVRPEDEQVRLVKGMERSVNHLIGLVISLREVVAKTETSPWDIPEYVEWWGDLPKRKILGLGIF